MPTNKNALIRYKILDNCFRNTGRRYFIKDLIDECSKVLVELDPSSNGISRRQILDDIDFMESNEGWSIDLVREREGKKMFYRYSDPSFSINNMPLNDIEINQLKSSMNILSQFKGMPQFEWVHELEAKLKQGISGGHDKKEIICFDNNQYLKGIENLGLLYNAVYYEKVMDILYQPFNKDIATNLLIHPYYLKQYNNRWFLYGYNPEFKRYDWNLALDRILSIKEINIPYHKNTQIDWTEYFEDIIGVTKSDNAHIENITLTFFSTTGKYIESKPIHGSQKSKWIKNDLLEVNLQLIVNYEFISFLLSYGESVKVISPVSLINKVKERLRNAYNQY